MSVVRTREELSKGLFELPIVRDTSSGLDSQRAAATPEFTERAIQLFHFQAEANPVYREFLERLSCPIDLVRRLEDIPFLPIGFFRSHDVRSGQAQGEKGLTFFSSGSTSMQRARHEVARPAWYEDVYMAGFRQCYGDPADWTFLCLLPSYLERSGSSLVYMCEGLVRASHASESGFFLHETEVLLDLAQQALKQERKVMLIGVSFALLDLAETGPYDLGGLVVVETGGMKGRRRELIREELHRRLMEGLGVDRVHSEYGMTELMSQAWSSDEGHFYAPSWMRVLVRELNDPFEFLPPGRIGGINIIDLANVDSCAFLATDDLGSLRPDGGFEVLGRFDHSDLRGCNLLLA